MSQINFKIGRGRKRVHIKISNHGYWEMYDAECMKKHLDKESMWYRHTVEDCLIFTGSIASSLVDTLPKYKLLMANSTKIAQTTARLKEEVKLLL